MQYTVYVLKDETDRVYKGMTSNLRKRMYDHRSGHTRTTSRMKNFNVAYGEVFDTFEAARKRELYFKTAAGRCFLAKKIGPVA